MVASLSLITLTLSALSFVSTRPVPRDTQIGGHLEGYLEAFNTFHDRYIQLGCSKQHGTPFFDLCCRPLLATEDLKDRDPSCDPANAPTSTSTTATAEATQTVVSNLSDDSGSGSQSDNGSNQDQGDDEDCDEQSGPDEDEEDCDDNDDSQSTPPPTSATVEATSSAPEQQAPPTSTPEQQPTSTTEEQAPPTSTTTEQQAPPTSTETPPPTSTTSAQESQPTQSQGGQGNNGNDSGNNGGGDLQTGGFATWFTQNGVAGACGAVHGDGDLIAAIDGDRYGDLGQKSGLCGKQVLITNNNNGKSVTVTIVDACPTCNNADSIDLSQGAFQAIASLDDGLVPISWTFV